MQQRGNTYLFSSCLLQATVRSIVRKKMEHISFLGHLVLLSTGVVLLLCVLLPSYKPHPACRAQGILFSHPQLACPVAREALAALGISEQKCSRMLTPCCLDPDPPSLGLSVQRSRPPDASLQSRVPGNTHLSPASPWKGQPEPPVLASRHKVMMAQMSQVLAARSPHLLWIQTETQTR